MQRESQRKSPVTLFWAKVDRRGEDECWFWLGHRNKKNYGQCQLRGRTMSAHRWAFVFTYGPISATDHICHSCDERYPPGDVTYRACCNPKHLWKGSHVENMADRNRKKRQAWGDRNGARTHPERIPRGERNGAWQSTWPRASGLNNGVYKRVKTLSPEQVKEIFDLMGTMPDKDIAEQFGISRTEMSRIRHKERFGVVSQELEANRIDRSLESAYWIERFMDKVRFDESGCWLYTGTPSHPTGVFKVGGSREKGGRNYTVDKLSWWIFTDVLPETTGSTNCEKPRCVHPEHLIFT